MDKINEKISSRVESVSNAGCIRVEYLLTQILHIENYSWSK